MSSCRKPECPGAHGEGGTKADPDHVVIHSHERRNGRIHMERVEPVTPDIAYMEWLEKRRAERNEPAETVEEDFALRPLATFLDKHGDGVYGYRLSGKWYLRVAGVTGTGRTFAEASADAMNKMRAVGATCTRDDCDNPAEKDSDLCAQCHDKAGERQDACDAEGL